VCPGSIRHLQVYALVDFDPDGLTIMCIYKRGSAALAHENHHLVTPTINWPGLSSETIQDLHQDPNKAWLKLTARDRRLATRMLERPVFQQDCEPRCRRELQVMLMLNIKAEIQVLGECADVERYLSAQLYRTPFSKVDESD
jgi:meiotic recombination protein SPO11